MSDAFKLGDRVYVTDAGLAKLRQFMRNATGEEPAPNHHGTVDDLWPDSVLINFDDGGAAPYPYSEVRHLRGEAATND